MANQHKKSMSVGVKVAIITGVFGVVVAVIAGVFELVHANQDLSLIPTPTTNASIPTSTPAVNPSVQCYGSAQQVAVTVINTPIQDIERTKTENCRDINVRFTTLPHPVMVQVCFVTTSVCEIHDTPNGWVTIQDPLIWKAVVTDVQPTTKFFLKFKPDDTSVAPFSVTAEIAC